MTPPNVNVTCVTGGPRTPQSSPRHIHDFIHTQFFLPYNHISVL